MKKIIVRAVEFIGFTMMLLGMASFDEPTLLGAGLLVVGIIFVITGETIDDNYVQDVK